jgi:hypothetical protein
MTTTADTAPEGRGGKADRILNASLLGVITAVVATSALTARPPAPPQVAQFAPQAQHHITRAQSRLSGDFGNPGGGPGGSGGQPKPTPKPTPSVPPPVLPPPPARSHNCFGDPPAQIGTDTQGPPCIPYWVGENGGATFRGVTATEIKVAVPKQLQGPPGSGDRVEKDLEKWFNKHFEFYKRQIRITLEDSATNCQPLITLADSYYKKGYFAATDPDTRSDDCFVNELARNKIIASGRIMSSLPDLTVKKLQELAPYVWSYERPADLQFADGGNFICSQWAGRKAAYAADPDLAARPRKYGLMFMTQQDLWSSQPSIDALKAAMARCGAKLDDIEYFDAVATDKNTGAADAQTWANNAAAHLSQQKITTVVVVCPDWPACPLFANGFSSNRYYPEILLVNSGMYYNWTAQAGWPAKDAKQSLFMLSPIPAQVPYPNVPLNRALAEVDPGFQITDGVDIWKQNIIYEQLLLIANGIQMAGPHLTPHTFAAGMQAAHFPNPYSPNLEGEVQVGPGGAAMTQDFSVQWWNDSAPSVNPDEGAGTWCYAMGGKRFDGEYFRKVRPSVLPPPPILSARCDNSPPGS